MAKNTVNKYVWLAETIHKAKKISFEEINRRWMDNDMSEGEPLCTRIDNCYGESRAQICARVIRGHQRSVTALL